MSVKRDDKTKANIIAGAAAAPSKFVNIGGERFCTGRTELDLNGRYLTDADIVALEHMTKLEKLSLGGNISDLAPLFGLKNLKSIDFFETRLAKEQIDELQKVLPDCKLVELAALE
ncbi:MAG: hypothetical protein LBO03_01680 [Acidaminococcales bacterium]|jgi:hypothetical protein|nr:hypothetical protein [Acidaminococcales bacterium]